MAEPHPLTVQHDECAPKATQQSTPEFEFTQKVESWGLIIGAGRSFAPALPTGTSQMINTSYILVLSDPSYAERQLRPIFWGDAWQRLSQSFSRCWSVE